MTEQDFSALGPGQRRLLLTRIKDLIDVDEFKMRDTVASLLVEFIRLAQHSSHSDYEYIIENGFRYGYEVQYSEHSDYRGNGSIRQTLNDTALSCHDTCLRVFHAKLIAFYDTIDNIALKDKWYCHDLRILFQNILANSFCSSTFVDDLGKRLEDMNKKTHKRREGQ
jgi:hypothetical protein